MSHDDVTEEELAELLERISESAKALIGGDVQRYLTLIHHADDYTLMDPFGGPTTYGFDDSPESVEGLERFFEGGEAEVDVAATYTCGDLVVLAVVERQRGRVGGLPEQDLSLRVTLVLRRVESGWHLVHRHADPLVHLIGLEHLAALARGTAESE